MRAARFGAAAFMLLAPMILFAQSDGTLTGRITNEEGEPVIGASVIVEGTTRGAYSRPPDGRYIIPGLNVGEHSITFRAKGLHPRSVRVMIYVDQTTQADITMTVDPIKVKEYEIFGKRGKSPISREPIRVDEIEANPSPNPLSLIGSVSGVSTSTVNGVSIRGFRPNQTSFLMEGVDVSDPFVGGHGSGRSALAPMQSTLGLEEIDVLKSGFGAEYDLFGGGINFVTRNGDRDGWHGAVRYRGNVPQLYGSGSPITVRIAGTDRDTVLMPAKLQSSGRDLYEFGVGGPLTSDFTAFFSGKYESIDNIGAGYEIYDMSDDYARARSALARQTLGYELRPTNLGRLPHQSAMIRDLTAKFKAILSSSVTIEFGGEIGLSSVEEGSWGSLYQNDHPVLFRGERNGLSQYDTLWNVTERDAQQSNSNTLIRRGFLTYEHWLDTLTRLSFTGSIVDRSWESGEKDESKSYGLFDLFDIHRPTDANGDIILDRYELPSSEGATIPYGGSSFGLFGRNELTGLIEGPAAAGASRNPYGLVDLRFPVHGNGSGYELRESRTLAFKGQMEHSFTLGDVEGRVRVGGDISIYDLSRHSNSLPWDQNPFFDIYGYEAGYFRYKDTSGQLEEFFANSYTPWEGAVFVSGAFDYKSITFQPGVRFDFYDPNTFAPPTRRGTFREVLASLDKGGDAPLKFQVSPRVAVGYPITDDSQLRVNFAMLFKRPDFNIMFDNAYGDAQRGNQLFGNPSISPERQFSYEIGYSVDIERIYYLDVAAYYRDIYNQTGVTYIPAVPNPYTLYSVAEFGNVRGLEVTAGRRMADNIRAEVNYTLQKAVGTATSPAGSYASAIGETDPYTGEAREVSLTEYPLNYDQTHKLNLSLGLAWKDGEGPSVGGIRLLQNTLITVNGVFATGLPYTLETVRGAQISEFNGMRLPSTFTTEAHIERGFKLRDLFGESVGNLELSLFADIFNLLNSTGPVSVNFSRNVGGSLFSVSGSPDLDGRSLDLNIGEFTATPYYKDVDPARPETFGSDQYDRYGTRMYNPYADANLDGVVTQSERYEGYQRFVTTIQGMRGSYQTPRTVSVGFKLRF